MMLMSYSVLMGLGAGSTLDLRRRRRLADFILMRIRSQLVSDDERQMYRSLYLTPEQLCQLQERTDQFVEGCQRGWDLIEAMLSAAAELSDCQVWG